MVVYVNNRSMKMKKNVGRRRHFVPKNDKQIPPFRAPDHGAVYSRMNEEYNNSLLTDDELADKLLTEMMNC